MRFDCQFVLAQCRKCALYDKVYTSSDYPNTKDLKEYMKKDGWRFTESGLLCKPCHDREKRIQKALKTPIIGKIRSIEGDKLHRSHGGWKKFLKERCTLVDVVKKVRCYSVSNQHYILFPCGTLILRFGCDGAYVMRQVEEKGPARVLSEIRKAREQIRKVLEGK